MITVQVVADSISPDDKRLTTFVLTYPRFIHAEIMTHRLFSRNASSSRAIPVAKMMEAIRNNPAMPEYWGSNKPGMQAGEELSDESPGTWDGYRTLSPREMAKGRWLAGRDHALGLAERLAEDGLHKQIANRVLEPWMHITVVCSATEWDNFYWLRTDAMAQPEFRILAERMLEVHNASTPVTLYPGEWHLPFVSDEEHLRIGTEKAKKASVARTARVSYLNHDGTAPDLDKDAGLHDMLLTSGHMSPFEHQATPAPTGRARCGNFIGFRQYRQTVPNENRTNFSGLLRKKHVSRAL